MNRERQFAARLKRLWETARLRLLLRGFLRAGAVALPAAAAAIWAAGGSRTPGPVLLGGLGLTLAALVLMLLWDQVLIPWRRLSSPRRLAQIIEKVAPCRNLVAAAAEPDTSGDDPVGREFRRRVVDKAERIVAGISVRDLVPLGHGTRVVVGWTIGSLVVLGLLLSGPEQIVLGLGRLLHPSAGELTPPTGGIYAIGIEDPVVEGETVVLGARDFGDDREAAVCQVRTGTGGWRDIAALEVPPPGYELTLRAPFRALEARLEDVREDFQWRYRSGTRVSAAQQVQVLRHPLLTAVAGRVLPPDYTHAPERNLEILPAVSEVPQGGRLVLTGTSSQPLRRALIVTDGGDSLAMTADATTVRGGFTVETETTFHVVLENEYGLFNRDPLTYRVLPLPDEKPAIRLDRPDDDGILPLGGQISLVAEAVDDFGLADVSLMLRPLGSGSPANPEAGWQGGSVWPLGADSTSNLVSELGPWSVRVVQSDGTARPLQARQELALDLAGLTLGAGEGLELVAVARDNRRPGAGQSTWSTILTLVLPSAGEVLADQTQARESRTAELEDARRRTRKLGQDLDRLTRELMKNPTPDWSRRQEMEDAIARRNELQDKLQEMSQRLQQELDRLAANQMTSERQLEMAEQVSQLMEQQDSPYLDSLLKKLDRPRGEVSPQDVARTLQEVARNQNDLARRMDMALAMMEKMDQQQELEGLTAMLEKIMQQQQELAEQSRALAEERKDQAGQSDRKEGQDPEGDSETKESASREASDETDLGERQQQGEKTGEGEQQEDQDVQQGQKSPEDQGAQEDADDLAAQQEILATQLDELQERLEAARKEAEKRAQEQNGQQSGEKSAQQLQQSLEEMLEQLKKQEAKQKMQQAGQQLQQLDPEQAAEMQEQALRDLSSLYHVLLESHEAMQMAMKNNEIKSLHGIAADLLDLSMRQEEIAQQVPSRLRDVRTREVTRKQHRMQQAATKVREKLAKLSTEAPMQTLELLKKLDGLIETMGYAVNAIEEGQGSSAQRQSRDALAQTNNIVIGLLTQAQMGSSSSSQGGETSSSLAEQLMQMIKEQAGTNELTAQLRKMLADRGMSQEARAQMKRLGEQQGQLAGRMQELAEQERVRPESGRLLGNLDQMGEDLQAITDDIEQGGVSDETLQRQERILSRMLDARNSVRQRDFSMRRESRTAERVYGDQQNGTLAEDARRERFRLRYQSLDAAPPDYQSLVRRYFSALDSLQRLETLPLPGDTP